MSILWTWPVSAVPDAKLVMDLQFIQKPIKNAECEPQFTQSLVEFGEIAQRMKEA
jgi:hypothetical protein